MTLISSREQFAITYASKRREYLKLAVKRPLTPLDIHKLECLVRELEYLRRLSAK